MRLGVLDMGSNTVHLLVVDAHRGARPLPAFSHKTELRLAELLDESGRITSSGARRLTSFMREALELAEDKGAEQVLAFATSAIREAVNGDEVLARLRHDVGQEITVLSGADEARLTFLAVRRWYGWSSRRLLCIDIGGGSLEMASGIDEDPDVALSLQLGAGRITRERLVGDPPSKDSVRDLRRYVRQQLGTVVGQVLREGAPDKTVGTSKTFRSLARVTGAAPAAEGMYALRMLERAALTEIIPSLAKQTASELAQLPGVSSSRAPQLLAGALVAEASMDLLEVDSLAICPWALREGVILRRIDTLAS
jgi:exopolyphosphatase / guanosine-5'-triphosphate,3'-diphosphate pyrophosphatase